MLDFFDEDFPLTKKQEEMIKAMEEAAKKAAIAEAPKPAGNEPLPMNTSPAADEPAHAEQPMQTYSEAAPKAEAVSEPATAAPEIAAEPIPESIPEAVSETVNKPIAETVSEIVPEPMAEAAPESVYEPVAEAAESIAEEASAEYAAEAIAESIPEAAAESEPLAEPTVPVYETEPAVEAISETVCEAAVPGEMPEPAVNKAFEPASEEIAEPAAEDISKAADEKVFEATVSEASETTASDVSETTQDGIPLPEPETAQSPDDDEDAAIKRIFQPSHEESTLPESDNQAFSYEYDSRYYAEEETPAYKYGVSPSARKRTRPARAAEAKDGNITVSTKTLLKVGAVVAATAAAVKLLSKKD